MALMSARLLTPPSGFVVPNRFSHWPREWHVNSVPLNLAIQGRAVKSEQFCGAQLVATGASEGAPDQLDLEMFHFAEEVDRTFQVGARFANRLYFALHLMEQRAQRIEPFVGHVT